MTWLSGLMLGLGIGATACGAVMLLCARLLRLDAAPRIIVRDQPAVTYYGIYIVPTRRLYWWDRSARRLRRTFIDGQPVTSRDSDWLDLSPLCDKLSEELIHDTHS